MIYPPQPWPLTAWDYIFLMACPSRTCPDRLVEANDAIVPRKPKGCQRSRFNGVTLNYSAGPLVVNTWHGARGTTRYDTRPCGFCNSDSLIGLAFLTRFNTKFSYKVLSHHPPSYVSEDLSETAYVRRMDET